MATTTAAGTKTEVPSFDPSNGISADPLDSADFNAVAYINQKFPTEESLSELDTFLVAIGSQIAALDEEISSTVQVIKVVRIS